MGADLKSTTTFQRFSLLLMQDCLIQLEHERTQDRIRRYGYDTIQGVIIWQRRSWWRIAICALLLVLPGALALLTGEITGYVVGGTLIGLGLVMIGWYSYCKVATIRIVRGGANIDIKGLFRPGRLRRFQNRFIANIVTMQSSSQPATSNATQPAPAPAQIFASPLPGDLPA